MAKVKWTVKADRLFNNYVFDAFWKYGRKTSKKWMQERITFADRVTKDGRDIGISNFATYSYYYRKFISHCTIDKAFAEEGTEVVIHWGDHGKTNIKEIRAKVARYPYSTMKDNRHYYND